jgi:hypothetical protein
MKSTKPNPFDWRSKPASLFTPSEKASMNFFVLAKSVQPKEMKTYSRAGAK